MFASSNWIHRKIFFISNSYLPTFFSCLSHLYLKCFLALGTNIFKYLCESFYFGNLKMIFVKLVGFLSASLDPKDVLSLNLYNSLQLVLLNFLSFSLLQALTRSHAHFAFHFWVLSNFRNMKYRKAKMNFIFWKLHNTFWCIMYNWCCNQNVILLISHIRNRTWFGRMWMSPVPEWKLLIFLR